MLDVQRQAIKKQLKYCSVTKLISLRSLAEVKICKTKSEEVCKSRKYLKIFRVVQSKYAVTLKDEFFSFFKCNIKLENSD